MKRTALKRPSKPLSRRYPLRARPRSRAPRTAAQAAWQAERYGTCGVCHRYGRVIFHHVLTERLVRQAGGDPYDQRNAFQIGAPYAWGGPCHCHDGHHHPGVNDTRIPLPLIPDVAVAFIVDLLGEFEAASYLASRYRPEHDGGPWRP